MHAAPPHAVEAYWDDSDGRDILTVEVFGNRPGMPLPNVEDVIAAAVDTARVRRDVRNEVWLAEWRAEAEEDTRRGICRANGWEYFG